MPCPYWPVRATPHLPLYILATLPEVAAPEVQAVPPAAGTAPWVWYGLGALLVIGFGLALTIAIRRYLRQR